MPVKSQKTVKKCLKWHFLKRCTPRKGDWNSYDVNYISMDCLVVANHILPNMQWKMLFCHAADTLAVIL
jgi:hypothetical protein